MKQPLVYALLRQCQGVGDIAAPFPALARATVRNVIPARRDFRGRLA